MKRQRSAAALSVGLLALALALRAASPSVPTLRMPGQADRVIAPLSLLGTDRKDVTVSDGKGSVAIYRGLPLLEVLEKKAST